MFVITWLTRQNKSNRLFDSKGFLAADTTSLLRLNLAGICLFGMIPLLFYKNSIVSLVLGDHMPTNYWLIAFSFLLLLITFTGFHSGWQMKLKLNNARVSSKAFLSQYFTFRILFLLSYELFFRGILLFSCIDLLGIFPAIILSTMLTVLIHVFTNKKEMWACIPFGLLLCSYSIAVHAVWPAFLFHMALSFAYELPPLNQLFIKLNPAK
jgi:membrane protease YdiL (CAAX protease family)